MNKEYSADALKSSSFTADNPYLMSASTSNSKLSLDTLVLNLYFTSSSAFPKLLKLLKESKKEIQAGMEQEKPLSFGTHGSFQFNLQRNGIKFFPYVLKSGDVSICISDRVGDDIEGLRIPSAKLHIGSISCQTSALEVLKEVKGFLSLQGITVWRDKVSRVDICHDFLFDLKDKDIRLFDEDFIVTKARSSALYRRNRKITGIQFGRGDVVLRIYDKLTELFGSHSVHKKQFFEDKWSGLVETAPDEYKEAYQESIKNETRAITRVEFQLRGKFLEGFLNNGSFYEFTKKLPAIWIHLTCEWFRHSDTEIDRENNNQAHSTVSEFWRTVQSIISLSMKRLKRKIHRLFKSEKGLREQLQGLLVTICAGRGLQSDDGLGIMRMCRDIVDEEIDTALDDELGFEKRFNIKQNRFILSF